MGESATSHNLLAAFIVVIKVIRLIVNTLTSKKESINMPPNEVIYWMVHRSSPTALQPTLSHASKESAEIEAQRLARQNPGVVFNVLVVDSAFCYTPSGSPVVPVQSVRE
jgi:hypothetical protein